MFGRTSYIPGLMVVLLFMPAAVLFPPFEYNGSSSCRVKAITPTFSPALGCPGVVSVGARYVTDEMFMAAATISRAELVDESDLSIGADLSAAGRHSVVSAEIGAAVAAITPTSRAWQLYRSRTTCMRLLRANRTALSLVRLNQCAGYDTERPLVR